MDPAARIRLCDGREPEATARVGLALEVSLFRQHREVVIHVTSGGNPHFLTDLSIRRRTVMLAHVLGDEVKDVPLAVAQYFHCHMSIRPGHLPPGPKA